MHVKARICSGVCLKIYIFLYLFLGFILASCTPGNDAINKNAPTSPELPSNETTTSESLITITGWFTIVWNDEPHYSITDDHGINTQLQMDDEIAKPLGGPLELDRKKITIVGKVIRDSPRTIRVLSVQFANGN